MQMCFMQHSYEAHCRQTPQGSSGVVLLTWCYQSRWCETASPAPPHSVCHRRRKPGTRPKTAYHHLQTHTHTNAHTTLKSFVIESVFAQKPEFNLRHKKLGIRLYYYKEPSLYCTSHAAFKGERR